MPVTSPLALGPAPREEWRLSLRNQARDAGIYSLIDENFGGVSYSPLTLGTDNTGKYDPCAAVEFPFEQRNASITWLAWAIYAWEDCPSIGAYRGGAADLITRATDKLIRQTSHLTEQVLWTGDIPEAPAATDTLEELAASVTPAADNRRLASTASTLIDGLGNHDLVDAFGYIYEWAASEAGAERVWIHVEPRLLSFLAFYGTAIRESARTLVTSLADHRIVAGTGYDGSAPEGRTTESAESWIYVTTPVRFFEGPVIAPDNPEAILDRSINRYRMAATRLVLAEWDLTVHGAIKVCLPGPGPECSATGS